MTLEQAAKEYRETKRLRLAAEKADTRAHDAWDRANNRSVDAQIAEEKARDRFLRLALRAAEDRQR